MTKTVSHSTEKPAIKQLPKADLISQKKKLELLALHFDPADFPPSDSLLKGLIKEFNLIGDDPFMITNQILVLLDQTLEEIKLLDQNQ